MLSTASIPRRIAPVSPLQQLKGWPRPQLLAALVAAAAMGAIVVAEGWRTEAASAVAMIAVRATRMRYATMAAVALAVASAAFVVTGPAATQGARALHAPQRIRATGTHRRPHSHRRLPATRHHRDHHRRR